MKNAVELCDEALRGLDSTGYYFYVVSDAKKILLGEHCLYTTDEIVEDLRDSVKCRNAREFPDLQPILLEIASAVEKVTA